MSKHLLRSDTPHSSEALIEAALEIAEQERETKRLLKKALLCGDDERVRTLASRLVGIEDDKERSRIN